jgi:hypothetical protein
MKIKRVKIFTKAGGLEELSRKEFLENLDMGVYDGQTIEIVKCEY